MFRMDASGAERSKYQELKLKGAKRSEKGKTVILEELATPVIKLVYASNSLFQSTDQTGMPVFELATPVSSFHVFLRFDS